MLAATMKNTRAATANPQIQTRTPRVTATVAAALLLALAVAGFVKFRAAPAPPPPTQAGTVVDSKPVVQARELRYKVVQSYAHDRDAFLQGLLWHDGSLYESTGLEGKSTLRKVEFPSGKVLQLLKLPPNVFGEGLALVDDRLIQVSWTSQRAFVYDRATFKLLNELSYEGQGWGLTYNGQQLIMSDGTDVLTYRDPETFKPVRKISVTLNGRLLDQLNELEWIEGEVWANVWQTDLIVRIDPQTGQVKSFLNLAGILPQHLRNGKEDVLNGIAFDPKARRILVGGKRWPKLFEIQVEEMGLVG